MITSSKTVTAKEAKNRKMKYRLIIDKGKEEEVIVTAHAASELTDMIEDLVLSYEGNNSIYAYSEDEIIRLSFEDTECFTVIDRKIFAVSCNGKKYRISHRLFELEAMLPSYFVRINKSTIANQRRIKQFKTAFSGAVDAIFKCGYTDYVSRRCFSEIKRRFEK